MAIRIIMAAVLREDTEKSKDFVVIECENEIYGGMTVRFGDNCVQQSRICKLLERFKVRWLSTVTRVGDQRI
jgi:hypothetical protein